MNELILSIILMLTPECEVKLPEKYHIYYLGYEKIYLIGYSMDEIILTDNNGLPGVYGLYDEWEKKISFDGAMGSIFAHGVSKSCLFKTKCDAIKFANWHKNWLQKHGSVKEVKP